MNKHSKFKHLGQFEETNSEKVDVIIIYHIHKIWTMMEIVQVIVDHAFVQNACRHFNISNKIFFITTIDIRIDLGPKRKRKRKQRIHLRLEWFHFLSVDQHMQMYIILFLPCQPLVFAFPSSTSKLVEYRQGWLNWAFTPIVILTNPSSFGLNMRLKVIGEKNLKSLSLSTCMHGISIPQLEPYFSQFF